MCEKIWCGFFVKVYSKLNFLGVKFLINWLFKYVFCVFVFILKWFVIMLNVLFVFLDVLCVVFVILVWWCRVFICVIKVNGLNGFVI